MIINEFESAHLKHSPRVPVNATKIEKIETNDNVNLQIWNFGNI